MKFLLDTNICIYIIKKKPKQVVDHFQRNKPGDIGISTITLSELTYGAEKSQKKSQNRLALLQFLATLEIVPYDAAAAEHYGIIRSELERTGQPIGALDLLIAAHARSANLTLVTNNVKEFSRVSALNIVNWAS